MRHGKRGKDGQFVKAKGEAKKPPKKAKKKGK